MVAGPEAVISFLRYNARPLVFTAALPPSNTAGVLAALHEAGAQASTLFSDVGAPIYEKSGYVVRPAEDLVFPPAPFPFLPPALAALA